MERPRAHRNLLPGVLEEALLYYAPVKRMVRWSGTETTIGDQCIEAGLVFYTLITSAKRDEASIPLR